MKQLKISPLKPIGIGPVINVAFYGSYVVALQTGAYPHLNHEHNGRLLVIDPETKDVIGKLEGIGSARQLVIHENIAYVTSREDGLFLIDLRNIVQPVLLSHYETAEFATGISFANDLLVVSLRQYGLELIDVRNPRSPRFISLVRTGEAQSVWLDGHCAYAGVWGSKELVIADIAKPEEPRLIARVPLDGRGDGVTVRDHICFAATGQHARPPKDVENPAPETYERLGNGLEIFDVHDPENPVRLSGVKFPPYYGLTFDMWDVQLCGDLAFVSNTRNGLFVVDISDLYHPRVLSRILLPVQADGTHDPIGGFAFQGRYLAVAGAGTDLFLGALSFDLPPLQQAWIDVSPDCPKQALALHFTAGQPLPWKRVWANMHVQAVLVDGDRLFVSCSEDGLMIVNRSTMEVLHRLPAAGAGLTHSAVWQAPYLYVAEGLAGMATYRETAKGFEKTSVYSPYGRSVNDVQLSGDGQAILLQCASLGVVALTLANPAEPVVIGESLDYIGLFYGRHFPQRGLGSDFFLAVNRDGLFRIRVTPNGIEREHLPAPEGFGIGPASGIERVEQQLIAICGGGEYFLTPLDHTPAQEPIRRWIRGGYDVSGKPRFHKGLMVISERAEGDIALCDASDLEDIRLITHIKTTASPDLAAMDDECIYLPGGRQGLLILKRPEWSKRSEKSC